MTLLPDENESESYEFDPERFMVPPIEGILKRLFGARWGMILVSGPETVDLEPILDFLASYSLQLAFYSRFSTETGDFSQLEREEPSVRTIDEVLEDAGSSVPGQDEGSEEASEGKAVRHVPRNPEIVFLPELDRKNIASSIEATMSGRLVISGILAEGSFPALRRYKLIVGSDHLAAASLMGVLGLNTVARVCPECKIHVEYQINEEDAMLLGKETEKLTGFRGTGCPECNNTGYQGTLLIHEGFEISENIRSKILDGTPLRNLRLYAKQEGMRTLLDAAWFLSDAGETTLDEVVRIADVTDPGPPVKID